MKNFRTFNLAAEFFRHCQSLKLSAVLKDQLIRASSSIALNLAEGHGRKLSKDQKRFFQIAFGSARESQAILILAGLKNSEADTVLDKLAAHIYKLIKYNG